MSEAPFQFSEEAVDQTALSWLNTLSAGQMAASFWDYPGQHGYSTSGYGLGRVTAARIVAQRPHSIAELDRIPGVGSDKISDLRVQALEAMMRGAYYGRTMEPQSLWNDLLQEGPGNPLGTIADCLRAHLTQRQEYGCREYRIKKLTLSVAFAALAWTPFSSQKGPVESNFLRVRLQPWAIMVHRQELWRLILQRSERGTFQSYVEKVS